MGDIYVSIVIDLDVVENPLVVREYLWFEIPLCFLQTKFQFVPNSSRCPIEIADCRSNVREPHPSQKWQIC